MLHVGNVSFEASFATLEITFDAGDPGPRSSIVLLDADGTIDSLSDFGRLDSFGLHVQEWVSELVGLCGILSVYSVLQASILDTRLMVRLVVFIKKMDASMACFYSTPRNPRTIGSQITAFLLKLVKRRPRRSVHRLIATYICP